MNEEPWYTVKRLDGLNAISAFYNQLRGNLRGWAYRGQRDAGWDLRTTLERAFERAAIQPGMTTAWESWLYREFQRRAHHFSDPPPDNDFVEWLALMQHHGCPTRLLDWTYSYWAALFFALEDCDSGGCAAIWALDLHWVHDKVSRLFPEPIAHELRTQPWSSANLASLLDAGSKVIWPVNPFRLNQRLATQQGLFLAQGNISHSFMDNLRGLAPGAEIKGHLMKLEIPVTRELLNDTLRELHRMNISRASLFPGLDGFAADLKNRVFMPDLFAGVQISPIWM